MADTNTIAQFITKMRRFAKDHPTLTRDKFDGDGTTTTFRTNHRPLLESSYTVKVGGTEKDETTHYTIDLDTGEFTFTAGNIPASGSDNVTIDYKYVNLRDTEWLDIISNAIKFYREKLWEEKTDETSMDTVKDQDDYDVFTNISTDIIAIVAAWVKKSTDVEWASIKAHNVNMKFYKEKGIVNVRPTFSTVMDIRFRYLEAYADVTATTDVFEPDVKFQSVYQHYCMAEYLERMAAQRAGELGAVTKERTYDPAASLIKLSDSYYKKAELLLSRIKPVKPATLIEAIVSGKKS